MASQLMAFPVVLSSIELVISHKDQSELKARFTFLLPQFYVMRVALNDREF
jgi:hypothetical protein